MSARMRSAKRRSVAITSCGARVHAIFKEARRNGSGNAMESRVSVWLRDCLMPLFLRLGAASQAKHCAYRLSWE